MLAFTTQFIALCFGIFITYWIATAFSTKPVAKEQHGSRWRLYVLPLGLVVIYVLRTQAVRGGGIVLWRHSLIVGIVADVLALCGLIVVLWARKTLGGNWSADVVIKQNHELIERGPYAYVRHPIYSGALLMVLSLVVDSGRLSWLIAFAFIGITLYVKARLEENLLTKHFPEAYPKYKSKVKALIPSVV